MRIWTILAIGMAACAAAGTPSWAQVVPTDSGHPNPLGAANPPAPMEAPRSAPAPTVRPAPAEGRLTGVSWSTQGPVGKVQIRTDAPLNYRSYATGDRIVIDLWQASNARWTTTPVAHAHVRRLRVRQYTPELARIYIDLRRPARYKVFVKSDPNVISVLVIPPWMATVKLPPSIAYEKRRVATGAGTTAIHILHVDPRARDIAIRPVIAGDVGTGLEPASIIATRHDAVAGINGGFFAGTGSPLGMVVIDGELVSAPLPRRSVFGIARSGEPLIQAFEFHGRVRTPDNRALWVSAVNRMPHAGGVAVYTPHYGPLTPMLSLAAVVRDGRVTGFTFGRILIPEDGYVLTANRADAHLLTDHLRLGEPATVTLGIAPNLELLSALGGGPRLVKNGRPFVPFGWEWFTEYLFASRAPRTAVGIRPNGKLIFVTVDGRSRQNTGMTLAELARVMAHLGARDAMNLDGGGSATMVVGGRTVNEPSDGRERPIGSALLLLRTAP